MPPRAAPSTARTTKPRHATVADLIAHLGGIAPERIHAEPIFGTATEADLNTSEGANCELIDGTLVEKAMGNAESLTGIRISALMWLHVEAANLGVVLGEAGYIRLGRGTVRAPDVTFIPWENFPDDDLPEEAYWSVAPGLIVEVLSPGNTPEEIDRKLGEFFAVGCKLAWVIDPATKTAKVYTSMKKVKVLAETGTLDGGKVLPGFALPLATLFTRPTRPTRKGR